MDIGDEIEVDVTVLLTTLEGTRMPAAFAAPTITITIGRQSRVYHAFATTVPPASVLDGLGSCCLRQELPPLPPAPWYLDPDWMSMLEVFGSLLSAALALVAVVYAWRVASRQFAVMDEQTALGREQKATAERQEAMAAEQGRIAREQHAIAETQHRIMEEQLARKALLHVEAAIVSESESVLLVKLLIKNSGTRMAPETYWHVATLREQSAGVSVTLKGNSSPESVEGIEGPLLRWSGLYNAPLFRRRGVNLGQVAVQKKKAVPVLRLFWQVSFDDGDVPEQFPERGSQAEAIEIRVSATGEPSTVVNEYVPRQAAVS